MFDSPDLPEASLSDNICIVEQALLDFDLFKTFRAADLAAPLDVLTASAGFFGVLLLPLVGELLGVFEIKPGFFLGIYEIVISEFVVDAVHVEI